MWSGMQGDRRTTNQVDCRGTLLASSPIHCGATYGIPRLCIIEYGLMISSIQLVKVVATRRRTEL